MKCDLVKGAKEQISASEQVSVLSLCLWKKEKKRTRVQRVENIIRMFYRIDRNSLQVFTKTHADYSYSQLLLSTSRV